MVTLLSFTCNWCIYLIFFFRNCAGQCPADYWIECAPGGSNCRIDWTDTFNETTIAYGNMKNNLWEFQDYSSLIPKDDWYILCQGGKNKNFGNPDLSGTAKVCCYNPKGSIIDNHMTGVQANQDNWQLIAPEGNSFYIPYSNTGYLWWVRFGTAGFYSYRLFNYYVDCTTAVFGIPTTTGSRHCDLFTIPFSTNFTYVSGFEQCGYQNSGLKSCNFNVSPSQNAPAVRLVSYGAGENYYYRFVLSGGANITCSDELFDDSDQGADKKCNILLADYSNYFTNNVGRWYLANSCSGCSSISITLEQGTSSTSSYATTQEWSQSLTKSVSMSAGFLIGGVTESTSYTTSQSIATTMSQTFTQSLTRSCTANCKIENATQLYLYQWILDTDELIGVEDSKISTYQCSYICSNSTIKPQCPLNYCANANCTECLQWQ